MINLKLKSDKCISCKGCVEVCPSLIFSVEGDRVVTTNVDSCISCGHCVAICPCDAIDHRHFPKSKIHEVAHPNIPAQDLLNLIRLRRSNRTFTDKDIPAEYLEMIVEAAYRAPTASNKQRLKFLLVKDRTTLDRIIDLTLNHYKGLVRVIDNPILRPIAIGVSGLISRYFYTFKRMIAQRDKGEDPILRGGKVLLVIYTDRSVQFGAEDANLAYQNASLMAECLGVSQVYAGFVCNYAKSSKRLNKLLDIKGEIMAAMSLGMPSRRFNRYIDKKSINYREI